MARFGFSVVAALGAAAVSCAQDTTVTPAVRRGLHALAVVPFGGTTLPESVDAGSHSLVTRVCLQGDGRRVFVGIHRARSNFEHLRAIDVADGTVHVVDGDGKAVLVGSTDAGPVLFDGRAITAPGCATWRSQEVDERTETFVSPHRPALVTCSLDERHRLVTRLVDAATNSDRTLRIEPHHVAAAAFAQNGAVGVARAMFTEDDGHTNEGILVLDGDGDTWCKLPPGRATVTHLSFAPAGNELYVVADGMSRIALPSGEVLAASGERPDFWAVLDDHAAIGCVDGGIHLYDSRSLQRVKDFPLDELPTKDAPVVQPAKVLRAAVDRDGKLLAVATRSAVRIYAITGGD